ncbi:MAG: D-alanine--D-alanine ligase [Gammaproteobacteria bacterium]|nr:D-alanine--D-alanine ligase [Gammaproteobacteria bacterium]
MRVGITFDLRADYLAAGYTELETAEFDRPDTIEVIETALRHLGHEPERVGNIKELTAALVAGRRWDLVFNIAEGLRGFSREAQVPALLEAYQIPYTFSDPLTCAVALHKGMAKRIARDHDIPTPDFVIVEDVSDLRDVRLPFPLFAKPVAEGTGKGVGADSKVENAHELRQVCLRLLNTFREPVIVESFLPGREFTVGIVGTGLDAEVIGTVEVDLADGAEADVYSYYNKEYCEGLVRYVRVKNEPKLIAQVESVALRAWRCLGARDAGRIDVRLNGEGEPEFLEANPLAGLNPAHSDLPIICELYGIPYEELIRRILRSAERRMEQGEFPCGSRPVYAA